MECDEDMERYSRKQSKSVNNKAIDEFIEEVLSVCRKHGLSIGHEDSQGSFIILNYDEVFSQWFQAADDDT